MVKFINTTPHKIYIQRSEEDILEIASDPDRQLRVNFTELAVGEIDGIPCISRESNGLDVVLFDLLVGITEPTIVLVSSMVLDAIKVTTKIDLSNNRKIYLAVPDTGASCIRTYDGVILAVTRLVI